MCHSVNKVLLHFVVKRGAQTPVKHSWGQRYDITQRIDSGEVAVNILGYKDTLGHTQGKTGEGLCWNVVIMAWLLLWRQKEDFPTSLSPDSLPVKLMQLLPSLGPDLIQPRSLNHNITPWPVCVTTTLSAQSPGGLDKMQWVSVCIKVLVKCETDYVWIHCIYKSCECDEVNAKCVVWYMLYDKITVCEAVAHSSWLHMRAQPHSHRVNPFIQQQPWTHAHIHTPVKCPITDTSFPPSFSTSRTLPKQSRSDTLKEHSKPAMTRRHKHTRSFFPLAS